MARGRWTDSEHERFLAGMKTYGPVWKTIADNVVKTRTPEQVRIHAQKYFSKKAKTAARKKPSNKDGHWTPEEHELFLKCWSQHGKAWKKLSQIMKTRTNEQIRTHAQKYFHKLRELRYRGYDGRYDMDGTRHLTKTFLQKSANKDPLPNFHWPKDAIKSGSSSNSRRRRNSSASSSSSESSYGDSDVNRSFASFSSMQSSGVGGERTPTAMQQEGGRGASTYVTRSGRQVTALWTQDMYTSDEEEEDDEEDEEEVAENQQDTEKGPVDVGKQGEDAEEEETPRKQAQKRQQQKKRVVMAVVPRRGKGKGLAVKGRNMEDDQLDDGHSGDDEGGEEDDEEVEYAQHTQSSSHRGTGGTSMMMQYHGAGTTTTMGPLTVTVREPAEGPGYYHHCYRTSAQQQQQQPTGGAGYGHYLGQCFVGMHEGALPAFEDLLDDEHDTGRTLQEIDDLFSFHQNEGATTEGGAGARREQHQHTTTTGGVATGGCGEGALLGVGGDAGLVDPHGSYSSHTVMTHASEDTMMGDWGGSSDHGPVGGDMMGMMTATAHNTTTATGNNTAAMQQQGAAEGCGGWTSYYPFANYNHHHSSSSSSHFGGCSSGTTAAAAGGATGAGHLMGEGAGGGAEQYGSYYSAATTTATGGGDDDDNSEGGRLMVMDNGTTTMPFKQQATTTTTTTTTGITSVHMI